MGALIAWIIGKTGWSERAARAAATTGIILLIVGALGTVVALVRKDAVDDHQAKIERRAAPATDKAATERASDIIEGARQQQEMHDVIEAQPDQPIAPTSHARGCEQLRRAGRNPPSCGGPASGR